MKIINNDSVLVQFKDLIYVLYYETNIPQLLRYKLYKIVFLSKYDFEEYIEFKNSDEIEYFNSIDWIMNYHFVKKLTCVEIEELKTSILDKTNTIMLEIKKNKYIGIYDLDNKWLLYNYQYASLYNLDNKKKILKKE